jgi:peptide chain release factor subunit 3
MLPFPFYHSLIQHTALLLCRNYIPSMIEGAAQADIGILVISARKGEFETGFERDGQTREHVLLAKTAGVKRIIMVINKMDDSTVGWEQGRYDEIVGKMMPFLKSVGYSAKDVDVLPISGFTGANMKEILDPSVCSWWTGQPLLTLLDEVPLDRKYTGPFLMPVADKTKVLFAFVTNELLLVNHLAYFLMRFN